MTTDFLVIGSGLAGLNFIIQVAKTDPDKKITVITKSTTEASNTELAQGGIAIVQSNADSFESHISDTLIAGDGLCDKKIVDMIVREGPTTLRDLIQLGVRFDKNEYGDFDLGIEGGHTKNRIIHYKDITGREIEQSLIRRVKELKNVQLLRHHLAVDLLVRNNTCHGARVLNESTGNLLNIQSNVTFMASGGIGHVYRSTTNPLVSTGDGIAMAQRAGAVISDMEFIQFHPTALHEPKSTPKFLISEAVRGLGAELCHADGSRFMKKYDERESLASRDIVSLAVNSEIEESNEENIYLDCTQIKSSEFKSHFPNILEKCQSIDINPSEDLIPVSPTQHYLCGGIKTDMWGQSSIQNLFAAGECARTGLHGANRLASNSLLEAFVMSKRCAIKACEQNLESYTPIKITSEEEVQLVNVDLQWVEFTRSKIQDVMWGSVGIIRTNKSLAHAKEYLIQYEQEINDVLKKSIPSVPLFELQNIASVARLITEQSIAREENKGGYFNADN